MTTTTDLRPSADDTATSPATARPPRPRRRAPWLAGVALAAGLGVAALAVADGPTDAPPVVDCAETAPASGDACGPLWGQVLALGLPESEWEAAAEAIGLSPRGSWISDDGLRWEHLDGRSYVVATPWFPAGQPAPASD
jgi:hypothetical protein